MGLLPDALGEHLRRRVEPRSQAAAVEAPAVPRVDRGPAAGRDHPSQDGCRVRRPQRPDGRPLPRPEARLALLLEDRRDRPARVRRDDLVEVQELGVVPPGDATPGGRLAAPGKADEDEVHRRA